MLQRRKLSILSTRALGTELEKLRGTKKFNFLIEKWVWIAIGPTPSPHP